MERNNSFVKIYRWRDEAVFAGILLAFAFMINHGIEIRGLSGEDLSLWSFYNGQPFWRFIFPIGNPSFRFVYYLFAYIQFAVVGTHISWFVPCNIIINGLIAYTVFRFGRSISKNSFLGFLGGFLYLLSRWSCYQISQVSGLLESMALWMAIGILYCVFQYVNQTEKEQPFFVAASLLYFGICFVHERFVTLILVLAAAFLMKVKKKPWNGAVAAGVFVLVQVIWRFATGSVFWVQIEGLGAVGKFLSNSGWPAAPRWAKGLNIVSYVVIIGITLAFLVKFIKEKTQQKSILCNTLLFALFIGCNMANVGISEQTDIFWLYVPVTAVGLFLVYMCGVIAGHGEKTLPDYHRMLACIFVLIIYSMLACPVEMYYRRTYPQFSFWQSQQRANSLAEQTYEKYGEIVFGKRIYILNNSYGMEESDIKTFLKTFHGRQKTEGIVVSFVRSIRDFGQVTNNMLILREEPKACAYQDITNFVKEIKCEAVYGYYPDTWMEESAKIRVMTGESGAIHLQLLYPGSMTGEEISAIYQDGVLVEEVEIDNNITYVDLQTGPYDTVELEFENNFYLKNIYEKRGESRLALMVRITTD